MGFIVDYSRVEGGWVVAGFLSVLTCLSFLFGTGFYAYSQNSRPDLRNPEKFI